MEFGFNRCAVQPSQHAERASGQNVSPNGTANDRWSTYRDGSRIGPSRADAAVARWSIEGGRPSRRTARQRRREGSEVTSSSVCSAQHPATSVACTGQAVARGRADHSSANNSTIENTSCRSVHPYQCASVAEKEHFRSVTANFGS